MNYIHVTAADWRMIRTAVSAVRDLGVCIDSHLSMRTRVKYTVLRCIAALRQLRHTSGWVLPATSDDGGCFGTLSTGLYGNGILVGLPAYLIRQLQLVLFAAARLIFRLKTNGHVFDALISLHWLWVPERIQDKLAVMACKVLHGRTPSYLGPFIRVADSPMCPVIEHSAPPEGPASWRFQSDPPPLAADLSQSLPHHSEVLFLRTSLPLSRCHPSKTTQKRHLFTDIIQPQWTSQWQCHLGWLWKYWLIDWVIDWCQGSVGLTLDYRLHCVH